MLTRKKHPFIALANILIFFICYMLHYSSSSVFAIKNAQPFIIIPLITAFAIFNQIGISAVAGLIMGIFMDSVASNALCFNTLVMFLIATAISLVSINLFNRNIRAAALLCFLAGLVYFILRWLIFYAFKIPIEDTVIYLLSCAFPSIVYTTFLIIPFYFIYKYFDKIINS